MSSIRKRNGKYQAQVRINGASLTRSFRTKSEASSWSRQQEARLETRKASGYKPSSLAEILQRYLKDVTPLKRNTRHYQSSTNPIQANASLVLPLHRVVYASMELCIFYIIFNCMWVHKQMPQTGHVRMTRVRC